MSDPRLIDARGPRFAAAVTVVVLGAALLVTPSVTSVVLLTLQALAFGAAAFLGIRAQPYGWFFRRVLAPRLGPAKHFEDPEPPRFAQAVGLAFVVVALVGLSFRLTLLAQIAIGLALAAAFLNAVFSLCLGCEIYLITRRIRSRVDGRSSSTAAAGVSADDASPLGHDDITARDGGDVPTADEVLVLQEHDPTAEPAIDPHETGIDAKPTGIDVDEISGGAEEPGVDTDALPQPEVVEPRQ